MHKKLEAELMSVAHQILQIKNKKDVSVLKEKAKEVYEKLSVLSYMDNYFAATPNASENKEELLAKMAQDNVVVSSKMVTEEMKHVKNSVKEESVLVEEVIEDNISSDNVIESKVEKEKIERQTNKALMEEASKIAQKINDLKEKPSINSLANTEEFKDTVSADITANLFEKAKLKEPETTKNEPIKQKVKEKVVKAVPTPKPTPSSSSASLNDRLSNQKIQIGLNDRIAFVKHLFNFSQEDFNRVLSQLNTFTSEQETKDFIANQVKPEYNWSNKEEYEERLYALIERRFL